MLELDLAALNGRFFDTFDPDSDQILVENQPSENLDDTRVWMEWIIEPGSEKIVQTGVQPIYERIGTATLQVHVPKGSYTGPGDDVAKKFSDAFRMWKSEDQKLRVYKMKQDKYDHPDNLQIDVMIYWISRRTP